MTTARDNIVQALEAAQTLASADLGSAFFESLAERVRENLLQALKKFDGIADDTTSTFEGYLASPEVDLIRARRF